MSGLMVNKLPSGTFGWLGVNGTELSGFADLGEMEEPRYEVEFLPQEFRGGSDGNDVYEIPDNFKSEDPVFFRLEWDRPFEKNVVIRIGKGSEVVLAMAYELAARNQARTDARLSVRVELAEYAKVKWIQFQRMAADVRLVDELFVDCGDGACFEVKQMFLGEGESYHGLHCGLNGYRSRFQADGAYMFHGNGTLDMNYVVTHQGRKTVSDINLSGVLRDHASKIFRGTIDFKRGAAGAEGAEKEDVLLMDPSVSNKTVPLILCEEENVSGTHGATIGKLGKELLFYLESRGMTREEIYEMMAEARMDALVDRIEETQVREVLRGYLKKGTDGRQEDAE